MARDFNLGLGLHGWPNKKSVDVFFLFFLILSRVVVAHAFNPSTWEAEAGGLLSLGQPGLQSEFQDSQGYTEKPCLQKKIFF